VLWPFLVAWGVALACGGVAWRMYAGAWRDVPDRIANAAPGLYRFTVDKFRVDELYDAVVVRPLVWLSRTVLWRGVDQGVVDGAAVNGVAKVSQGLGWLGSRLQTGQVGVYIVLFLVGALWILGAVIR